MALQLRKSSFANSRRLAFVLLLMLIGITISGCSTDPETSLIPTTNSSPTATATAAVEEPAAAAVTPTKARSSVYLSHVPAELPPDQEDPATPAATASPQPTPTLSPDAWQSMPVIPTLSPRALAILQDGLARGRDSRVFAKIGDCESQTEWFLDPFDHGADSYSLGPYQEELQPVIDYYQGSFDRNSLAARQGFTAASLLSPIWADQQQCEKNETPLACEYRVSNASVAFIMLGTNDAVNPKTFEKHMRKVIEYTIEQGVLPVLGTKADNIEGDHAINATIARLAYEYDIPMWNYWLAVQNLPDRGLQEDGSHLTYAGPFFDSPRAMEKAWPVRNLNALQVLRVIMDQVE
ncbi:MAG: hypothetical protein GX491_04340 [Chloroflexi bacterium]|nr:hypothetical protein [Chloroflexota bacterium]